jgi:zinc transport system substrate-binding protein
MGVGSRRCTVLLAILLALFLTGCEGAEQEPAPRPRDARQRLAVYTVNEPLRDLAVRIGGDAVDVSFPAPTDVDPAQWSPDPETVAAYQSADLIVLQGSGYAGWVERATLPSGRVVDTSATFADRLIPIEDAMTHGHGPEGEHTHTGVAQTTWLDPTLATLQARAVADALTRARPEHAAAFGERLVSAEAELRALDERLGAVAEGWGARPLLFSHPVYAYLARRYGLNGQSLHWEPDELPDEREWEKMTALLEAHPARWILWEDEPVGETVRRLEALGVRSVVYAPCANTPVRGDFLSVMRDNAARLEAALRPGPSTPGPGG